MMAMLTKAISWALGLQADEVADRADEEMEDVTDEQHDRTTCCYPPATIGYEVEEYYDTSGEKYGVISVKEKTPPEEESREDRESSTESDDANKSSMSLQVVTCPDMPIRTKYSSGVLYNDELHVGGGYTTSSKDASKVFVFNSIFNMWSELPPSPLKWFSMAILNGQLVLVGGKEAASSSLSYTNKLAVWNQEDNAWSFSLPPMAVARSMPIVISHGRSLIVAGGKKGSLDFNMELYNSSSRRWYSAPPLPLHCLMHTSAVIGDTWYLLRLKDGEIFHANICSLIASVQAEDLHADPFLDAPTTNGHAAADVKGGLWQKLHAKPPGSPFRIIAFEEHLLSLSSNGNGNITLHALPVSVSEPSWVHVGKLPELCSYASAYSTPEQLYLFGGDAANKQYSHKMFKVSLLSKEEAARLKKERHVAIGTATVNA